jgi:hypothetical protein
LECSVFGNSIGAEAGAEAEAVDNKDARDPPPLFEEAVDNKDARDPPPLFKEAVDNKDARDSPPLFEEAVDEKDGRDLSLPPVQETAGEFEEARDSLEGDPKENRFL